MRSECHIEEISADSYQQEIQNYEHSIFMTRHWVESMINETSESIFLRIYHNNKPIGIAAGLVLKGSMLQGRQLYFYSAPALINNNQEVLQQCLKALKKYARQNNYTRINIRPWDQQHSFIADVQGFITTETHEFPINYTRTNSNSQISSRIMRNIKKGQKTDVEIKRCKSLKALDVLLELLSDTHNRRELKYGKEYSPFYLYNLNKYTVERLINNDSAILYCASIDNRVHSVELNLEYEGKAYNVLKASIDEAYQNGISSLLDFHMIQHYKENNFNYFNLGGELINGEGMGLSMYKEGLGGEKIKKRGYYTYYITFPRCCLNPLMHLGKNLPDNSIISTIKKWGSNLLTASSK